MAVRYICALRNKEAGGGLADELYYTEEHQAEAFTKRWSRPGIGIYDCIGALQEGATRRCKETVAELDRVVSDLDLKDIVQPRDETIKISQSLLMEPSEIRDSGNGLHNVWLLKEPVTDEAGLCEAESIMAQLATLLAGDPAPTHRAALLRRLGSINSKGGIAKPCHVIGGSGQRYDISEFADMIDLYGQPLLTRKTNGDGRVSNADHPFDVGHAQESGPVDVEACLAAMAHEGTGRAVNEAYTKVVPALLRKGEHPDDVLNRWVDAVMAMAEQHRLGWTREAEVKETRRRMLSTLRNLLLAKYDHTTGALPDWLPGDFHEPWMVVLATGRRPCFGVNHCGFYVRRERETAQSTGPAKNVEEPAGNKTGTGPKTAQPGEPKKYKFPLLRFGKMRPGTEPNYLVDELIPVAGLVVVYGAPKSGKSLWVLDLVMHIALFWEYRERAVQQGTVIYCAFEGAHGYHKRSEAFRRHHGLTDEDPPLYILPGRANLVKDHATLIREIRDQIAPDQEAGRAGPVRCVVLDTLNKSLIGSESKDIDMANYIAAAEAIQAAFGCVVIIVHHHGVGESRPRGHTSLRGAVDAQIKVTRDDRNNIVVEIEDMRDGPEGAQIVSRLAVVEVGTDKAGRPLTSAAVEPVDPATHGTGGRKLPKLTRNQHTMFSILASSPAGLTGDDWNEQARTAGLGVKRRADLVDLRTTLRQRGLVFESSDRWFVADKYKPSSV